MPAGLPKFVKSTKKGTGSHSDVPFAAGRQILHDEEKRSYLARSEEGRRVLAKKGGIGGLFSGSEKLYPTAELLLHACLEYFQWCENNPLYKQLTRFDSKSGKWQVTKEPYLRMRTLAGLRFYLGLSERTWQEYRASDDYRDVCEEIEAAIRDERETGAAVGILDSNFVAKLIGLTEKREITGKDGGPVEHTFDAKKLSDAALEEIIAAQDAFEAEQE